MKAIKTISLALLLATTGVFPAFSTDNKKKNDDMKTSENKETKGIFPKGDVIKNDYFKGTAWLQMLVTDKENFDMTVGNVVFEPGCRNNWHSHPGGQILLCTKGIGYYQEKGKKIQLLNVGDVVEIRPDVIHWHGASPDSEFEHIAIGPQSHKGAVVWMEPVTDGEYNSYVK